MLLATLFAALLASQGASVAVAVTADDRPVPGARVTAGGGSVVTDGAGRAVIVVAPGIEQIAIEADGFLPATVSLAPGLPSGDLHVELEPLAEFEEAIVVLASRSPTRLQDQPLRVEVIDREEIEEKALMTPGSVAMLVGETTGLRVQPTAPSLGAANVRIQGLRGRYSHVIADGLPLYGGQGDSFSLLQVPPLDLGQVEIIKGVASALYGASALGGVINLVSRRPGVAAREALFNQTSLGGQDATVFLAEAPAVRVRWSVISGFHRQGRRDRDDDGWTDVAGYTRGMVRPRVFYDSGAGATLLVTAGVTAEDRRGGTLDGRVAPDGHPFTEGLDSRRADAGGVLRWVTSGAQLMSVRVSHARNGQSRGFGDVREHGVRSTSFGEVSVQGLARGHTWVAGAAFQRDAYRAKDLPRFDYAFDAPAMFVQDEFGAGALRVAASARVDVHDHYGALVSPRASLLWRPEPAWTLRLSGGGGSFAPTPFVEETDATGLSRLATPAGLRAERAWGGSLDLTRRVGALELNATAFASVVRRPVGTLTSSAGLSQLVNAASPTRTWGSEAMGRYRAGAFLAIATYAYTRAREQDIETGTRREVPLTPRHYAALDAMIEREAWGRAGIEVYYVGRQALDDNPYRREAVGQVLVGALVEKRLGHVRVFVNAENLGDRRQTRYEPLVRPDRQPDGRWTVDAWAPLDGRVVNAGIRLVF